MNMIFLGAPGAGKGTHAARVSEKLHIPTISTGALLRTEIRDGTDLGKEADRYISRGNLVPDEVVIGMVKERIAREDCKEGFILDGFPRTISQAQALIDLGIRIDCVLNLLVSDEEIVRRMRDRRVCPNCGKTYSVHNHPSADGIHCDLCGTALEARADDQPETVMARLKVYHDQTEPLVAFYRDLGLLRDVDSTQKMDAVSESVFRALGV